jgi:hypothetical protein
VPAAPPEQKLLFARELARGRDDRGHRQARDIGGRADALTPAAQRKRRNAQRPRRREFVML